MISLIFLLVSGNILLVLYRLYRDGSPHLTVTVFCAIAIFLGIVALYLQGQGV